MDEEWMMIILYSSNYLTQEKRRQGIILRNITLSRRTNDRDEGRELFIVNIDFDASESDVRELLSQVRHPPLP
jgi:hypothetical protein